MSGCKIHFPSVEYKSAKLFVNNIEMVQKRGRKAVYLDCSYDDMVKSVKVNQKQ